ncbi:MarR family winged helix-turn-helix transcriptional regulator [Thalassospira marina]|uniref:MarR family transcriptional regulator n=1 Tax=Thalassospira marina TaxID=2048283 RepID=A0A2N3KRJ3_9PROT|nr:MarR family winged helix-turn-helix transcriptional regulator [Thalassospira marina]AUG53583.1 MarR family transcriptional regulator [Thalassospira marina]PKR53116.1 MarR family transcriptional regulator [Thalassospira marina]
MTITLPDALIDECLVLKSRRAARAVTRRYNLLLKPHGLQSTQASLLFCICWGGFQSISSLARLMDLERSALTRNLAVLQRHGLIAPDQTGQGRTQVFSLTSQGEEKVQQILPVWQQAQKEILGELGAEDWQDVQKALSLIATIG